MRPLLSVDDALAQVLARVTAPVGGGQDETPLPRHHARESAPRARTFASSGPERRTECLALAAAAGRVLAETICADREYPAFPRSRVDGYAVRAGDVAAPAELPVAFEVAAGAPPPPDLPNGAAARVFTGAAVPRGADAVVMQEDCTVPAAGRVVVTRSPGVGDHVVPVGHECLRGAVVGAPGDVVGAALLGALASVGAATVRVAARPTVRVVATGDEVVPIESDPPPGRIRNSNAPALLAAAASFGAHADRAFHATDSRAALAALLPEALAADICVLTGGVSVGDYDLVPEALVAAGVERVFHGVRLQPGKPLWFGVRGRTLVFGLPGNPVSSLVTAELFVRPAVRCLLGLDPLPPGPRRAVLTGPLRAGTWRRRFDPVRLEYRVDGATLAHPVRFRGSGDVFGFAAADGLAVVPEDSPELPTGRDVAVVPLAAWRL